MNRQIIGSISHGTMRNEDLIPDFLDTLEYLNPDHPDIPRIKTAMETEGYFDSEDAGYDLNETLFEALNELAPRYFYFGSHPGDGSDYGFWPSDCIEDDFEGLKVSDISEVPGGYSGEVLHINDHGNMALYDCDNGQFVEVWSIV